MIKYNTLSKNDFYILTKYKISIFRMSENDHLKANTIKSQESIQIIISNRNYGAIHIRSSIHSLLQKIRKFKTNKK